MKPLFDTLCDNLSVVHAFLELFSCQQWNVLIFKIPPNCLSLPPLERFLVHRTDNLAARKRLPSTGYGGLHRLLPCTANIFAVSRERQSIRCKHMTQPHTLNGCKCIGTRGVMTSPNVMRTSWPPCSSSFQGMFKARLSKPSRMISASKLAAPVCPQVASVEPTSMNKHGVSRKGP